MFFGFKNGKMKRVVGLYDTIFEDILDKIYHNDDRIPKVSIFLFGILVLTMAKKSKDCNYDVSIYEIGYEVGQYISPKNNDELKTVFENLGLGVLTFENDKTLKVENNPLAKMVKSEEPVNYFAAGFLAGALESIHSKKIIIVKETKCMAQGYDACYFEIVPIEEVE